MDIWKTGLENDGEGAGELLSDDKWARRFFFSDDAGLSFPQ